MDNDDDEFFVLHNVPNIYEALEKNSPQKASQNIIDGFHVNASVTHNKVKQTKILNLYKLK